MIVINDVPFEDAIAKLDYHFRWGSKLVHTDKWQGVNIKDKPEMATYELQNVVMHVPLEGEESLDTYRNSIKPNLPWADHHFAERVYGEPLNPGETWRDWPYAHSADRFRTAEIFNHTYMERYWPKRANIDAKTSAAGAQHEGIRHTYGDLANVVELLHKDPLTRQAYIPIFFPEDTGIGDGGRKPCTLGYQFMLRDNVLMVYYPIRSCDFVRHFRDDCYLTVRLLLWVLQQLRKKDRMWNLVRPGEYVMHMTSLHMFKNDYIQVYGVER